MPVNPEDRSGLITQCLNTVRKQLADAARRYARDPASLHLLAVTKQQSIGAITAAVQAGQRDFGESYLQEALPKIATCKQLTLDRPINWHWIGQIQSNKTREIAEHFHWVHTLDRDKIAQRLNDQWSDYHPMDAPPLQVCIQVKLADEDAKGGISPDKVESLARYVIALPRLRLRGLMCIPPPSKTFEQQRYYFAELATLQTQLNQQLRATGVQLDTLSMGMSGDYEAAIAEGATMVRIGTAIFGERA